MFNTPSFEQCSEDMDLSIIPVLLILDERMKHLELSMGTEWAVNNAGTSEIATLENKC